MLGFCLICTFPRHAIITVASSYVYFPCCVCKSTVSLPLTLTVFLVLLLQSSLLLVILSHNPSSKFHAHLISHLTLLVQLFHISPSITLFYLPSFEDLFHGKLSHVSLLIPWPCWVFQKKHTHMKSQKSKLTSIYKWKKTWFASFCVGAILLKMLA